MTADNGGFPWMEKHSMTFNVDEIIGGKISQSIIVKIITENGVFRESARTA